jgi:wyosine [tRNA(Phe)-imidazoG37] synthetase (radical SAM superfamily)
MSSGEKLISFGPVPSRRLGQSLGINNIPHKVCTYSCVYCQVGRTRNKQIERQRFYSPADIAKDVEMRLKEADFRKEPIDYLSFVPDGEPTLDENLGREIDLLKSFGKKVAVITNASLLWKSDVRDDLQKADWVSIKVDAVSKYVWKKINRGNRLLNLETVLSGSMDFSESFNGILATETMLIHQMNDSTEELHKIAEFLSILKPDKSYISIPTRPPAEKWVQASSAYNFAQSYSIFKGFSLDTEYLLGYEGNTFAFTGNAEEDILRITSVHPMRKDAVEELLSKAGSKWAIIEDLIGEEKLIEVTYEEKKYYIRKFQ